MSRQMDGPKTAEKGALPSRGGGLLACFGMVAGRKNKMVSLGKSAVAAVIKLSCRRQAYSKHLSHRHCAVGVEFAGSAPVHKAVCRSKANAVVIPCVFIDIRVHAGRVSLEQVFYRVDAVFCL